jgi:2-keto-3-deoxy-L-fuconate dehydrogenase
MGPLHGQVAVVTAAGQGIGRASAIALQRAGADVIATDIDQALLDDLATATGVATRQLDVLDDAAVHAVIGGIERIDVLFNCAGRVDRGAVLDMTDEQLVVAFDLNVRSMVRTIHAALPRMLERESGCIINMSSVVSSVKGAVDRCAYGITKAAVIGLTKSVAADYVTRGIRCNAICPGTVETPSLHQRVAALGDFDTAMAGFVARQPMGRLGRAEEIADLVVHLAGATFTTGHIHVVDGGWAM